MNKMSKKLGKRVLSWLLCVALVVALMPGMEMRRVKAATLNGSGTAEDPYQISNYTELLEFAKLVNDGQSAACAKLMNDIDASESANYNIMSGVRWMPIGENESQAYTGTFDGNGKKIKDLVVSGEVFTGVFGCLGNGGVIKNLIKEGGSVTGQEGVGGIVGYNAQGTIEYCCNTGTVSGVYSVGGVVGINGDQFSPLAFTISNCYNTGAVSGNNHVGGVVGASHGSLRIKECYNIGPVTGTDNEALIGGIAGAAYTIFHCYNIGEVTGTGAGACVGGITGHEADHVDYCFYNTDLCHVPSGAAGKEDAYHQAMGLTTEQMTDPLSTILGTGLGGDWFFLNSTSDCAYYPHLQGFDLDEEGIQMSADEIAQAGRWPAKAAVGYEVKLAEGTLTYNGQEQTPTIVISKGGVDLGASDYVLEGVTKATNAGTYPFKYTILSTGAFAAGTFEIKKVSAPSALAEENKPVAKTDLKENGSAQALLTAPSAFPEGYTIEYSTDNGESWSTDVPTGKEAKEYAVLVRYKGDQNHEDFDGETLTVTIGEASIDGLSWNEEEEYYEISNYAGLKAFADIVNGTATIVDKSGKGNAANAKLMNNIECKNNPADSDYATDWMPICDDHEISEGLYLRYEGTFDGQEHVIKGLNNTDNGAISYAGLFGVIGENGIVRKLFLEDGCFTGNSAVGGIAGINYGSIEKCCNGAAVSGGTVVGGVVGDNYGEVHNCQNTGTVVGGVQIDSRIGGIVGTNSGGIIENCHNAADIVFTGDLAYVGGIVGSNRKMGTVENCNNTGAMAVTGEAAYVGGIVGEGSFDAIIKNCYNAGAVAVTGHAVCVGGIVGAGSGGQIIKNCYNAGAMAGTGDYACVGGIVGVLTKGTVENGYNIGAITKTGENGYASGVVGGGASVTSVTATNCYFDKEMCAITVNGVAVAVDAKMAIGDQRNTKTVKGLTTAEMTGEGALARMGFSSENWNEHENDDDSGMAYYPFPKGFAYDESHSVADWAPRVCYISNYAQLKAFADLVNGTGDYAGKGDPSANAILMADIECKYNASDAEYAKDWMPIGDVAYGYDVTHPIYHNIKYMGVFDGQGHVIRRLSNTGNANTSYAGLFGCIGETGVVKNLVLQDEEFAVRDEDIK
ncbi:MAG: hypothetical protein J5546_00895, partial [Lachnospiraceae bacterium]|nr:hypothetical protein [Lachnospiraceae bacterium]